MSQSTEIFLKLPEMVLTLTLPNGVLRRTMEWEEWAVVTFTGGKAIDLFLQQVGDENLTRAMGTRDLWYIRACLRDAIEYYKGWTEESMMSPSPIDEAKLVISCFS